MNPTPSRQIVAGEVRAAMGRAGISQSQLADRIPMSHGALSERLSCKRPFSTDHLFAIAEVLGVDPLSLLTAPKAHQQPEDAA